MALSVLNNKEDINMAEIILNDVEIKDYNDFVASLNEIDPQYLDLLKELKRLKENNY